MAEGGQWEGPNEPGGNVKTPGRARGLAGVVVRTLEGGFSVVRAGSWSAGGGAWKVGGRPQLHWLALGVGRHASVSPWQQERAAPKKCPPARKMMNQTGR